MTPRLASTLAPIALLAGCTVGPDYRMPEFAMPAAFRSAPIAAPLDDKPWWTTFGDALLDDLVSRGLKSNLDIEVALARVDRARAAAGAARVVQLPAGAIDGSAMRARQSLEAGLGQLSRYVPDIERTQDAFALTGGASWELDLAGGLRRGRESAAADLAAAAADSRAARLTVAGEITDAYLLLRALQEQRDIAIKQAEVAHKLEELVRMKFTRDVASRRELDEANTSAISVRAQVPSFDAAIDGQLNRLAVLVGEMPQAERQGLDVIVPLPTATLTSIGTPVDLLRRRPDLIAAERRLAASNARIGSALAEYYPRFTLSSLLGFQGNSIGQLFTDRSSILQGGLGLRWRIFDFKRINAEIADARGAEREALAIFRGAVLRAAEDVERAVAAKQAAERRIALHGKELAASKHAGVLAVQAYEAGHIALIEVIEIDRRSLQATLSLALARADAARAVAATYRAIGAS